MARYIGPLCKLCRRQGEKLMLMGERCLAVKCAVEKRAGPPGQRFARRRKLSDRGLQLREKQKARMTYGVLERQFRRYFQKAGRQPGITGENLLRMLEMRLDNVVYRLGFANSRAQARQLVGHGHIFLNGRKTNIPSCIVKPSDVIGWNPKSLRSQYYRTMVREIQSKYVPSWLSLDMQNLTGQVLSPPAREEMDSTINEHLVLEYYSR